MKRDTVCIHSARDKQREYGAIATPIYQSATFVHHGVEEESEYCYSRMQNPSRAALEQLIAKLEGGPDAIAFASGMAAETAMMTLLESSGHVIAGDDLYGGSIRLFRHISMPSGIRFDFVDTTNLAAVKAAVKPDTKVIYLETPTNPVMRVSDIRAIADIAHEAGAILIVDNTFMTPLFQRPLELGADLVVYSGTKYFGGHNDTVAGFLVPSTLEMSEKLRFYAKTIGGCLAPFDCFLIERGIKTLAVRLERQAANAEKIAHFLRTVPKVKKVYYVGFEDHPNFAVTQKQSTGYGAMISIEVDTPGTAKNVLRNVKVFQYAESLGGVESLITYPMLQTHADVPEKERLARGINDRFLRISVGIEHIDDLIADLKHALGD